MGWNQVDACAYSCERGAGRHPDLFAGVEPGGDFYFVHSFHLQCDDADDVAATTPYCGRFVSAVQRCNVLGGQFHPEKSQANGFKVLTNFLSWDGAPC